MKTDHKTMYYLHPQTFKDINIQFLKEKNINLPVKEAKELKRDITDKDKYYYDLIKKSLRVELCLSNEEVSEMLKIAKNVGIKFTATRIAEKYTTDYFNDGDYYSGKWSNSQKSDWRQVTYQHFIKNGLKYKQVADTIQCARDGMRLVNLQETKSMKFAENKNYIVTAAVSKFGIIIEYEIKDKKTEMSYHDQAPANEGFLTFSKAKKNTELVNKITNSLIKKLQYKEEKQRKIDNKKEQLKNPNILLNAEFLRKKWGFCDSGISEFCTLTDLEPQKSYTAASVLNAIKTKAKELKDLDAEFLKEFRMFRRWLSLII